MISTVYGHVLEKNRTDRARFTGSAVRCCYDCVSSIRLFPLWLAMSSGGPTARWRAFMVTEAIERPVGRTKLLFFVELFFVFCHAHECV